MHVFISLILQSGPSFQGVSHREASSGCDISLETEIWIQGEEKGGGESYSLQCIYNLALKAGMAVFK